MLSLGSSCVMYPCLKDFWDTFISKSFRWSLEYSTANTVPKNQKGGQIIIYNYTIAILQNNTRVQINHNYVKNINSIKLVKKTVRQWKDYNPRNRVYKVK